MAEAVLHQSTPGAGFDEAVEAFLRSYLEHPFSTYLILPNVAVRDAVKCAIAERGTPVFGASVCTLNELAEFLFDCLNHSDIRLDQYAIELVLYKLLESNRKALPLFDGPWGTTQAMVPDIRAFLETMSDYQADYPEILGGMRSERSEQLGRIRDLYVEFLSSNSMVDRGSMLRWVTEEIKKSGEVRVHHAIFYGLYEPKPIEKEFIRSVLSIAERADYHIPFVQGSKAFSDDGSWLDANDIVEAEGDGANIAAALYSQGRKERSERIVKGTFKDPLDEMRAVAREIRKLIDSGVEPGKIAVALPVRSKAAPLVREVFEDYGLPFNLLVETSLAESPLVASVFSILEAVRSDYDRDAIVRLVRSPFFAFRFDHDGRRTYLSGHEVDRVSIEAQVIRGKGTWSSALVSLANQVHDEIARSDGPPEASPKRFELERIDRVGRGLEWLFAELSALEGDLTVGQRTDALRGLLIRFRVADNIEKDDDIIYEREVRALRAFLSALEAMEMGEHIAPSGRTGPKEFLAKLRMLASAEGIYESPDNKNAVQVTGLRASYLVRYDYLFIVGMVDGDIPYLAAGNPFVREGEAVRMGLLRKNDLLRQERFYFLAALLSSNVRAYISRAESDGSNMLVPSIFWDHLEAAFEMDDFGSSAKESSALCCQRMVGEMLSKKHGIEAVSVDLPVPLREVHRRISVECDERAGEYCSPYDGVFADEAAKSGLNDLLARKSVHSPSKLEAYARCPFGFYLRYVVGIEPPKEVETELNPAGRGTLFHRIVFRFYSELRDRGEVRITEARLDEMTERIRRIGQEELDRYKFDGPVWRAYRVNILGSGDRKGLLRAFLEKEAANTSDLRPKFFELSFGTPLKDGEADPASRAEPAEIDLGGEKLLLRCRIDRVDVSEDGRFVVLDYKTGNKVPSVKSIEQGTALQLPLYIQAVEAAVDGARGIGGAYYIVRNEAAVNHDGVFGDKDQREILETCFGKRQYRESFAGMIAQSNRFILSHLEGMRAGRFHPTLNPKRNCPSGCDYAMVCRVNHDRGGKDDDD